MTDAASSAPRKVCYRCFKPSELCLCARIPLVQNRTGIYVLQHAHERLHVVGTLRIARLGLAKIDVTVQSPNDVGPSPLGERLAPGTGLLYPGEGARDLASLGAGERPPQLLLLDGTWTQAQHLCRLNPWLSRLPRFSLTPERPSQYRIRREPSPNHVSTIEAIVGALRILEPELVGLGLDGLLAAFIAMIDGQEARGSVREGRYRRPRPPRRARAIPDVLALAPERVVLARAEFSYQQRPEGGRYHELVQLVGRRLLEPERFEALLRPERLVLSDQRLRHIGLTRADFDAGEDAASCGQRWQRFLRPDDVVAFWNQGERDAYVSATGCAPAAAVVLHAAYCNARRRRSGALVEVLAHEGLSFMPEPCRGRAGIPLGQLVAVARLLCELASPGRRDPELGASGQPGGRCPRKCATPS